MSPCPDPATLGSNYLLEWHEIAEELEDMQNDHGAINTGKIGQSYTGNNDILAVQFGAREAIPNPPTVYVVAAYHAREWIASSVALYLARWLRDTLVNPSHDPTSTMLCSSPRSSSCRWPTRTATR